MKEFSGRATAHLESTPRAVFERITDVDGLPAWNAAIEAVIERPPELTTGSEWTVKMHPARMMTWKSVSCVEELDDDRLRFAYVTHNADRNPSYVRWAWNVAGDGDGADVTVTWECPLLTLDRKMLGGPIRRRQLA